MLRQIPGAGLQKLDRAVYFQARPDGIAVRFRAGKEESDRFPAGRAVVLECLHVRPQAALQQKVEISTAIEIGYGKGAAVERAIETAHAGEIAVAAVAPHVKNIGLAAIPAIALANELVDGIPAVLICLGALSDYRRPCHHLAPEEAL